MIEKSVVLWVLNICKNRYNRFKALLYSLKIASGCSSGPDNAGLSHHDHENGKPNGSLVNHLVSLFQPG
jgi:hypothetical protein